MQLKHFASLFSCGVFSYVLAAAGVSNAAPLVGFAKAGIYRPNARTEKNPKQENILLVEFGGEDLASLKKELNLKPSGLESVASALDCDLKPVAVVEAHATEKSPRNGPEKEEQSDSAKPVDFVCRFVIFPDGHMESVALGEHTNQKLFQETHVRFTLIEKKGTPSSMLVNFTGEIADEIYRAVYASGGKSKLIQGRTESTTLHIGQNGAMLPIED